MKDFLDEIIEERTTNNPDFLQMVDNVVQEENGLDYKIYTKEEEKVRAEAYRLVAEDPIERLPEDEYNLMESIISLWVYDFDEKLRKILQPLSDEQVQKQYEIFSKTIHENGKQKYSRLPIYDEIAKRIKSELIWRPLLQEAKDYVDENPGVHYYCYGCGKQCGSEEEHDANFFKNRQSYVPEPEEHKKFNRMSRDELLFLIKLMTPVLK